MTLASANTRQSNIELLRLVCMLFVTFHHFISWGMAYGVHTGETFYLKTFWGLNGFVYIGVNCFILISGYFGINFKWRKLLNLYLTCVFYFLGIGIISLAIKGFTSVGISALLLNSFLPISHNNAWFISCYFLLMLLTPLLNPALNVLDKKNYQLCILLLSIINLYFGYFWKLEYSGNIDGFTLMQFVWLYVIAGYIRRYVSIDRLQEHKWMLLGLYIGCALIYGGLSIYDMSHRVWHWDGWKYNNPILVIGSITFFLFFLTLNIKSKLINFAAASVFGMYLAQGELDIHTGFYKIVGNWYLEHSGGVIPIEYLVALLIVIIFMLATLLIDQLRKFSITPILKLYDIIFAR